MASSFTGLILLVSADRNMELDLQDLLSSETMEFCMAFETDGDAELDKLFEDVSPSASAANSVCTEWSMPSSSVAREPSSAGTTELPTAHSPVATELDQLHPPSTPTQISATSGRFAEPVTDT